VVPTKAHLYRSRCAPAARACLRRDGRECRSRVRAFQDALRHWRDHIYGISIEGKTPNLSRAIFALSFQWSGNRPCLRDAQARAEQAIQTITSLDPAPSTPGIIKFLHLDLNDLASVKAAAAAFAQQETKLDILWNNAGTGANAVELGARTAQGFEPMAGMHLIATLLFTQLLLPQLRAAATAATAAGTPGSVRVVWTSSIITDGGSPTNGVDFDRLAEGTPDRVLNYAVSKAGSWMLGREMASRYGKDGIVSVTQNPGNIKAGSYAGTPALTMFFVNPLLHATKFGGYTELYAGLSPDVSLETNGTYIVPWGKIRTDDECPRKDLINAMTPEEKGGLGYGKRLWEWCEEQWKPFV
jgi:NAD(P)-dependent dehydrogenase (short-subunit alcohol dehydrogenase family)